MTPADKINNNYIISNLEIEKFRNDGYLIVKNMIDFEESEYLLKISKSLY